MIKEIFYIRYELSENKKIFIGFSPVRFLLDNKTSYLLYNEEWDRGILYPVKDKNLIDMYYSSDQNIYNLSCELAMIEFNKL